MNFDIGESGEQTLVSYTVKDQLKKPYSEYCKAEYEYLILNFSFETERN